MAPSATSFISRTDNIIDVSNVDLRASDIGETDSSKISRAFSPEPAVSARSPKRINGCQDIPNMEIKAEHLSAIAKTYHVACQGNLLRRTLLD